MLGNLLLALNAAAALAAIAFWIAAMYLWFLRNHSSRSGVSVSRGQVALRFAAALGFTVVAAAVRLLREIALAT